MSIEKQDATMLVSFRFLDEVLLAHRDWWSPQPFKHRPGWAAQWPRLTDYLLSLSDAQVSHCAHDSHSALTLLAPFVPGLQALQSWKEPRLDRSQPLETVKAAWSYAIPGRKWEQIQAFIPALGAIHRPVLEWCGGKGHLGRYVAARWKIPVTTLEWDERLCAHGRHLSDRLGVPHRFCCCDVTHHADRELLSRSHTLALHACGELHRGLVRRAVEARAPALDIVPCCYAHGVIQEYEPFTAYGGLKLSRDDLRLAVTQTGTGATADVIARDRDMAWKLAFAAIRRDLARCDTYRPIAPVPKAWLKAPFQSYCRQLALREKWDLPGMDAQTFDRYEQRGWQDQREVMRLSVVRFAFRRALEWWLVLDMALYLVQHGYAVELGTFCGAAITPRNILLSARRA